MASVFPASATTPPNLALAGKASQLVPAVLAMLLGLFVVGVAGFSPINVVHNAAHDTRHSNGFPCH